MDMTAPPSSAPFSSCGGGARGARSKRLVVAAVAAGLLVTVVLLHSGGGSGGSAPDSGRRQAAAVARLSASVAEPEPKAAHPTTGLPQLPPSSGRATDHEADDEHEPATFSPEELAAGVAPTPVPTPAPRPVNRWGEGQSPWEKELDPDIAETGNYPPALLRALRILDEPSFADRQCPGDREIARRQRLNHTRNLRPAVGDDGDESGSTASSSTEKGDHLRIGILTFTDGAFQDAATRTLMCESQWNHLQYARRHGYDLLWDDTTDVRTNPLRTGHWNKLVSIHRWLPHYDWLLWMDADAIFFEQSIRLEDIIRKAEGDRHRLHRGGPLKFIIAREPPSSQGPYNSGVMLIRGSGGRSPMKHRRDGGGGGAADDLASSDDFMSEFLRAVYHYPRGWTEPYNMYNTQEQGPLNFLMNGVPKTKFSFHASGWAALAEPHVLNAKPHPLFDIKLPDPNPYTSLVLHYAGYYLMKKRHERWMGPMAFMRGAARAAMNFQDEDSMTLHACCAYKRRLHVRRRIRVGGVGSNETAEEAPASRRPGDPKPASWADLALPSAEVMQRMRDAKPPWRVPQGFVPPPPAW